MTQNNQLPRATAEMAARYNEIEKLFLGELSDGQRDSLNKELAELVEGHNWFNYEFTDPETGKVGVKDVAGNVLVPARYDGAYFLMNYMLTPHAPHAMSLDGKCGIVAADGSGKELTKFEYVDAHPIFATPFFAVRHEGDKDHFGIITHNGTMLVDYVLTGISEGANAMLIIEKDDKVGVIDLNTYQVVMPEYDDIETELDELVLFTRDGKQGYVNTEGRFVAIEDYENGNYEGDDNFLIASYAY